MIDLRERRSAFDSFFAACASELEQPDQLHALASRTLARQALWRASRAVDRGVEQELVEELTDFALDTYPESRHLREWRGLRLRQWIGAGRSILFPPLEIVNTVVPTSAASESPLTPLKTVICPPSGTVSLRLKTMVALSLPGL